MRNAWSRAEIATLLQKHGEGRSYAEIGSAIGRTGAATKAQAARLRVSGDLVTRHRRSTLTPENIQKAQRLQAEGLTPLQIGRRLGTSGTYVSKMLAVVTGHPANMISGEPATDPRVLVRELETARAALARAERRYAEAMAPIHNAVRAAIRSANLPWFDMAEPDRDAAEDLCTALREEGYVVVQASQA